MGRQIADPLGRFQSDLRTQILDLRSVLAMINQPTFQQLWEKTDASDQGRVEYWIYKGDRHRLRTWIRDHPHLELSEKSTRQLKNIAQLLSIPGYSRMSKYQLVIAISGVQE